MNKCTDVPLNPGLGVKITITVVDPAGQPTDSLALGMCLADLIHEDWVLESLVTETTGEVVATLSRNWG
jgi:hypothetical protein